MIQDIAPHRLANEYRPDVEPSPGDTVFYVRGQELAARRVDDAEVGFELPRVGDPGVPDAGLTYLFALDDEAYWLAPQEGFAVPPEGYEFVGHMTLRLEHRGTRERMFAAFTAVHLAGWYARTRFCGSCGSHMEHDTRQRALRCPSCGAVVFPRINPAVIVCVRDPERDKIVITRYARGRYVPIDALVAGFVEIGETIEECVHREVREELGIEVKNVTYYRSQPWGVAGDILSGFWCDVDGDPTLHMDTTELGRAAWVGPDEVVGQPDDLSLTNEMMCRWRDEHYAAS